MTLFLVLSVPVLALVYTIAYQHGYHNAREDYDDNYRIDFGENIEVE